MTSRCSVCHRTASNGETLCEYHRKAYLRLREVYDAWRTALEIGWEQYLDLVAANENTGEWSREVIRYLLKEKQGEARAPRSVSPTGSPVPP